MKKALVLGASGGMGYSIVNELSSRGIHVVAFARTKAKLEKLFKENENVTVMAGDLFQIADLEAAASGTEFIFQAANIPYPDWGKKWPVLMSNVLHVSEQQSAKLVMVDNIYAYGRSKGKKINEMTPKHPHTKKGNIRLQVEELIRESNVPSLIAHFPDFYGPNAENTVLHYTLQNAVRNQKFGYVGDQKIAREFIFTPDGARAIVNLALSEASYGQNWNIPGSGVIPGEEVVRIIGSLTGCDKRVSTVTKNMIRFLGFFNASMKETVEMFYLYEDPVVLDGAKYEKLIGSLPSTSYEEGLRQTIDYMKKCESSS
jgi:nucleoside-diphosphate-sugar epimerase